MHSMTVYMIIDHNFHAIIMVIIYETRPSVNYAKDWLDHSFLFPGLVWSEKEFYFGYDH